MRPRWRNGIGLLTLGGAALLAAGFALELEWLAPAAAGCGLLAGMLGWLARPVPPAAAPIPSPRPAMAEMAPLLRELAEEMVRLKRDSAEASRGMAEARASGARMVQAAAGAIARLDESAETSAIAARALSMLPGIADSHAQRIELMAARAEQALALVPQTLTVPPVFEAVMTRLEGIALPDTFALREAVERLDRLPGEIGQAMHGSLAEAHDAAAALLDQTAARIEAARPDPLLAVGLMEATERLDALARPLERARESAEAWASRFEADDAAAALRTERLESALARMGEADTARLERLEATILRLEEPTASTESSDAFARIEQALGESRLEAGVADKVQELLTRIEDSFRGFPQLQAALSAVLEPLDAAGTVLPPITEAAQRATEALLRAAQANLVLAARAREAPAAFEPPTPLDALTEPAPGEAPPDEVPNAEAVRETTNHPAAPAGPTVEAADQATEPARPPRLLENLDETIRGLQSLSSAIAAAAERRLESAA